jgi:hypothetical protein
LSFYSWVHEHQRRAVALLKSIGRQKKNLWKLKYFTRKKYNLQKNPLKETKILQDIIITLITNLKIQHKPKLSSFKTPHIKK